MLWENNTEVRVVYGVSGAENVLVFSYLDHYDGLQRSGDGQGTAVCVCMCVCACVCVVCVCMHVCGVCVHVCVCVCVCVCYICTTHNWFNMHNA